MKKLTINLENYSYDIVIEDEILFHLSFYIKQLYKGDRIYIITDDVVANLYLERVTKALEEHFFVQSVIIPHGEESKSLSVFSSVCETLLEKDIRRNHLLLALGGGVVGDLTGFVASTLYRGLPYVGVPTSLLSQLDSSIGGKTGIDFYGRKNILGAFKQPLMVFIDPQVLETLEEREFNNGMGELIKHAAIGNISLLDMLESKPKISEEIIYQSLLVKKALVELDEFDVKERMFLNFGHTYGHAIELDMGLKHGEAVSLGMLMALQMGIDLKITNEKCYEKIKKVLDIYHLPNYSIDYHKYFTEVVYDKKNLAGKVRFVLLRDFGNPVFYEALEQELKEGKI